MMQKNGAPLRIVVGLRVHAVHGKPAPLDQIFHICKSYFPFSSSRKDTVVEWILIAVNDAHLAEDIRSKVQSLGEECFDHIKVMLVSPWLFVTPALNALLAEACRLKGTHILFQSTEVLLKKPDNALQLLAQPFSQTGTLVVGAALEGHLYKPPSGSQRDIHGGEIYRLNGVTSPWNTFALWDLSKLSRTGFLPISDGLTPLLEESVGLKGGVEEVVAIATIQKLFCAEANRAMLIHVPELNWKTEWSDPARAEFHSKKMASKRERADAQLKAMGLDCFHASVHHI